MKKIFFVEFLKLTFWFFVVVLSMTTVGVVITGPSRIKESFITGVAVASAVLIMAVVATSRSRGRRGLGVVTLPLLLLIFSTGCVATSYDQQGRRTTYRWPSNGGTTVAIANASVFAMNARVIGPSFAGDHGPGVKDLTPAGGMAEFFFANSAIVSTDRGHVTIAITFVDVDGSIIDVDEVRVNTRSRSGEYRSDMITVGRNLRRRR